MITATQYICDGTVSSLHDYPISIGSLSGWANQKFLGDIAYVNVAGGPPNGPIQEIGTWLLNAGAGDRIENFGPNGMTGNVIGAQWVNDDLCDDGGAE